MKENQKCNYLKYKDLKNQKSNDKELQNSLYKKFSLNELKAKKSFFNDSPIFSVKYSTFQPNLLTACDENGNLIIFETSNEIENQTNARNTDSNRYSKIYPLESYNAHDNSIFDFEWINTDKKFITASGDMKCKIINTDKGNFLNEYSFIGHSKSVKCVKQAFYNENLFTSCGRDGPIGGFKSINKNLLLNNSNKKRSNNTTNNLNDTNGTFTSVGFLDHNMIISIESKDDDIKFWDTRKMLNLEELNIINNFNNKPNNKFRTQINKIEEKKSLINSINPISFYEYKFAEIQENIKFSSKNLKEEKNLFNKNELNREFSKIKFGKLENENKISYDSTTGITNSTSDLQSYSFIKEEFKNFSDSKFPSANKIFFSDNKKYKEEINEKINEKYLSTISFNEENEKKINNEINFEEEFIRSKLKDAKNKKTLRGSSSLFINRNHSKILVNSISNSLFLYDSIFFDKTPPMELKGFKSSYYVKSVLSPDCNFVLSGSNDASIYLWNIKNRFEYQITNPFSDVGNINAISFNFHHGMEVNSVDWSRSNENFIASASDDGILILWDDK